MFPVFTHAYHLCGVRIELEYVFQECSVWSFYSSIFLSLLRFCLRYEAILSLRTDLYTCEFRRSQYEPAPSTGWGGRHVWDKAKQTSVGLLLFVKWYIGVRFLQAEEVTNHVPLSWFSGFFVAVMSCFWTFFHFIFPPQILMSPWFVVLSCVNEETSFNSEWAHLFLGFLLLQMTRDSVS